MQQSRAIMAPIQQATQTEQENNNLPSPTLAQPFQPIHPLNQTTSEPQLVADYEELAGFNHSFAPEQAELNQIQLYMDYTRLLQRRAMAKLERKTVRAHHQADLAQKKRLQNQLKKIAYHKAQIQQQRGQALLSEISQLEETIALQQELKESLKDNLESLMSMNRQSQQIIDLFPRQQLKQYNLSLQRQNHQIKTSARKIHSQIALKDVLLSNLQQIIAELQPG